MMQEDIEITLETPSPAKDERLAAFNRAAASDDHYLLLHLMMREAAGHTRTFMRKTLV